MNGNPYHGFFELCLHSLRKINGQVAQSVEQRTENPCVGGSIPSLATFIVPEKSSGKEDTE